MNNRTAITVLRDRAELERLWNDPQYQPEYIRDIGATVTFKDAPGDRGTEIHVDPGDGAGSRLGAVAQLVKAADPLAKVKDDLRRFKARVETGVIPRSDGSPEGEMAERKLKQRPAQPLDESELQKAGVS
jgi:uncharacterized membrane protein